MPAIAGFFTSGDFIMPLRAVPMHKQQTPCYSAKDYQQMQLARMRIQAWRDVAYVQYVVNKACFHLGEMKNPNVRKSK